MNGFSEKILVVGAGPQALFLVRELSRLNYQVILIGRKSEIAMHSKYAEKITIESEEHLVLELNSLASANAKLKAYVASGFYLAFLMNHFPKFFQLFHACPGHKASVNQLMCKTKTYELAQKAGVLYPQSFLLNDIDRKQIEELKYPQIVKWNQDIYLFAKPSFKTSLVRNSTEMIQLIQNVNTQEKKSLITQEFLGADLSNNFSYGAYVNQGKVKLDICVNEVRHFRSGVSSVVEEYAGTYAEAITKQAALIITETQFTGFLDVEFKIKDGNLYLLEINPRPFGFIKIMKKKYPDLIPYVMGHKMVAHKNPQKVKWINVLRDMVLIIKNPGEVFHMLKVLFDFNKRTFDVWDINDPLPFFYQMKR
jgi:predicted ATP-grasp superfamily ATP-dependent carboligase